MSSLGPIFLCFAISFIILGFNSCHSDAVPYDSSFTHKCLENPLEPLYNGGIAVDAEHSKECENSNVEIRVSEDNNTYFAALIYLNQTADLQRFHLQKDKLYAFSVWVQVSEGSPYVEALFRTKCTKHITVGWVSAKEGCWRMLKGGLVAYESGPYELFFRSDDFTPNAEVWIDSISLQPFTRQEWRSHQLRNVESVRMSRLKFRVSDDQSRPIANAKLSIRQTKPHFPFGNAMNEHILNNTAYREWFVPRFRYTVFENEMKWYYTEPFVHGQVNYTVPDSMVRFAKSHDIAVRGHTVLWESHNCQTVWNFNMTRNQSEEFRGFVDERVRSIVRQYKGQLVHWDVMNENMHHHYITDMLGKNSSSVYYKMVHEIDPETPLFLNDYMTIEKSSDKDASTWKYLEKIWEIREQGYKGRFGIGLQGHFKGMNLVYIRASLDVLASVNMPIWITELDVGNETKGDQANFLDWIIREVHSHEAVDGIIMWAAMTPGFGCWRMCITDDNYNNLETGDVVDRIIGEWSHEGGVEGFTDDEGCFETKLYHGEYEVNVSYPNPISKNNLQKFKVVPIRESDGVIDIEIVF